MTSKKPAALQIRSIGDGRWYWAPKAVIQEKAEKLGFLALAVYHFLASMADEHQRCYPSQKYIAVRLGCARTSVTKAIKTLALHGLVGVDKEGKSRNKYRLLKVGGRTEEPPVSAAGTSNVTGDDTNDNERRSNKNDTNGRSASQSISAPKEFKPQNREELLALDLAQALNDLKGLALYLSYAKKYPETLLRQVLGEVTALSPRKIKKSRGALFTFLVKRYGEKLS